MLSGWIGACGCIAWDALLESASVPADMGLPDWAPELKFWAKPSGESAFVGAEGSDECVAADGFGALMLRADCVIGVPVSAGD
ncbi:hypothetical protein CIW47_05245 [Mycolicibacterium sp. P1-5]|nr:hypothetical protein CIW47_05245 [Mycolicibacterium sp. P1-5]